MNFGKLTDYRKPPVAEYRGEIRKRGGGKLVQLEGAAAGVSPGAPSRHGVATRRPVTEEAVEEEIPDEEVIEEGVEEEEEPVTLPVRRN